MTPRAVTVSIQCEDAEMAALAQFLFEHGQIWALTRLFRIDSMRFGDVVYKWRTRTAPRKPKDARK